MRRKGNYQPVMIRGGKRQSAVRDKHLGTTIFGACFLRRVGRSRPLVVRRGRALVLTMLIAGVMRVRVMQGLGVNRGCVMVMKACRHCDHGQGLPRQHQHQQHYRKMAYTHGHDPIITRTDCGITVAECGPRSARVRFQVPRSQTVRLGVSLKCRRRGLRFLARRFAIRASA